MLWHYLSLWKNAGDAWVCHLWVPLDTSRCLSSLELGRERRVMVTTSNHQWTAPKGTSDIHLCFSLSATQMWHLGIFLHVKSSHEDRVRLPPSHTLEVRALTTDTPSLPRLSPRVQHSWAVTTQALQAAALGNPALAVD